MTLNEKQYHKLLRLLLFKLSCIVIESHNNINNNNLQDINDLFGIKTSNKTEGFKSSINTRVEILNIIVYTVESTDAATETAVKHATETAVKHATEVWQIKINYNNNNNNNNNNSMLFNKSIISISSSSSFLMNDDYEMKIINKNLSLLLKNIQDCILKNYNNNWQRRQ